MSNRCMAIGQEKMQKGAFAVDVQDIVLSHAEIPGIPMLLHVYT